MVALALTDTDGPSVVTSKDLRHHVGRGVVRGEQDVRVVDRC